MSLWSFRLICILTGVVILIAAATMIPSDILFLKDADVAEGTIIQVRTFNGNVSYRPVVAFQTRAGQQMEVEKLINASPRRAVPEIGEQVRVYYQPDNPEEARLINLRVDLIYLVSGVLLIVIFFYLRRILKLFRGYTWRGYLQFITPLSY